MQAVHVRRESLEARGLVPSSDAQKTPLGTKKYGPRTCCQSIGSFDGMEHVLLRAGASVYGLGGARVGTALRDTEMGVVHGARRSKDPLVHVRFTFWELGSFDAKVKPGDLRPYR